MLAFKRKLTQIRQFEEPAVCLQEFSRKIRMHHSPQCQCMMSPKIVHQQFEGVSYVVGSGKHLADMISGVDAKFKARC
jgi:hypothetical protein